MVHSAGCFYIQRFCDRDYDSWEKMVSLNIMGALALIGELINPMKVVNQRCDDNCQAQGHLSSPTTEMILRYRVSNGLLTNQHTTR